jgi:hypothetical protein
MTTTFIYGLTSTIDDKIRYIGKSNDPKDRLRKHLYECRKNNEENKTHKCCWIRSVIKKGEDIKYVVLEECEFNKWEETECKYINLYENLTNTSKGGVGGSPKLFNLTYDELIIWKKNNVPKNCNTKKKWREFIKASNNLQIPINPDKVYSNSGWVSWSFFLDTKNKSPKYYNENNLSFNEFKEWVSLSQIRSSKDFFDKVKLKEIPDNIPKKPHNFYKNKGWTKWFDVTNGGKYMKGDYWNYEKCKEFLMVKYGNMTVKDFRKLCKDNELPIQIPKKPERVFNDFNYSDFLNGGINKKKKSDDFYYSLEELKLIVKENNINKVSEWRNFIKEKNKDKRIPGSPDWTYRDKWVSWNDFLNKKVRN